MKTPTRLSRPALQPARRRALLQSCATSAIVALLVAAGSSGAVRADSGNACVAQSNSPCVINTSGSNGPAGPNKGDSGGNGNAGTAASHGFQTPQTYAPTGPTFVAPIDIVASGGNGGDGQHDIDLEANGGNGGNGASGGAVTVSAVPGVNVTTANPSAGGSTAPAAVLVFSGGGSGGLGAVGGHQGTNGTGGIGGNGGSVAVVPFDASIASTVANVTGLFAGSYGGNGGNGGSYFSDGIQSSNDDGANAGSAGAAGNVAIEFGGTINAQGAGLMAVSAGGNGGTGGDPYKSFPVGASGGNGGNGGVAGTVTVTIDSTGTVATTTQDSAPAIWARSLGGQGGAGGQGGGDASGGEAGSGANAGNIVVTNNGTLGTGGGNSPGILAQSFGGAGANGGNGGGWGSGGGDGGTGGAGGAISVGGSGSVATTGTNSPGVLAQSIGGGGGNGGNSTGWLAVGGAGATAADGGTVTIEAAGTITTGGERSPGVLAQSVGGGGGNGGNASGSGLGLNLIIGGTGGGGGTAAEVDATSSATIQTSGLHASGIVLQSIGGGGGNGGAAYGSETSLIAGANVSLGGSGGDGGSGAPIGLPSGATATNTGEITTSGASSFGILGQSIGGGGGVGGSSASTAKTYAADTDPPLPSISIAVSLGGSGGSGGAGRPVTLGNAGLIATSGQGSAGLVAQSIGGGGGAGGDSSANAVAQGGDGPITISSSISLGGTGGGGGSGQNVSAFNAGMIVTTGESSDGLLAASIGGGGGVGGAGDGQAKASGGGTSISTTLNLGGSGGGGGGGGPVTLTNTGAILTLGDGAAGMVAEGIGGGGGRGGGGAGSAGGGGSFSATVTLGGSGGNGGTTAPVFATNNGSIVTFGADAAGIVAQSVGGGGGDGGKAASSIGTAKSTSDGGNGTAATVGGGIGSLQTLFQQKGAANATAAFNSALGLVSLADTLLGNVGVGDATPGDGLESLGESGGSNEDGNQSFTITAKVTVGGSGGAGASAGPVTVSTGAGSSIGTVGAMSDAIVAQSIGGGGGKGGAASTATSSGDGQVAIAVGGSGGSGGDGGTVSVGNQGNVTTIGGDAVGVLAQSVGGGGGEGGASGSKGGALKSVAISIGGSGSTNGTAGAVAVTNSGTIETRSHDAIGILAQSIGGGGGVVKTLSSDAQDNNGGGAVTTGGSYDIGLTFGGGAAGSTNSGNAGSVTVANAAGTILTKGANAFGILAQSIGGGGGVTLGGQITSNTNFFGAATLLGSADQTSGVAVLQAGTIETQGAGASAILAQSIGGGGGLAGNIGWTTQLVPFQQSGSHVGNGGPITIAAQPNSVTETAGANAPAIFAQSIGGGGGRVATQQGAANGSAGGIGTGGTVSIDIFGGALVSATGQSSAGIYAESAGQGGAGAPITIQLSPGAKVSGGSAIYSDGSDAPGIMVDSGSVSATAPNLVENSGTITSAGGTGGMAILNRVGYLSVTNEFGGVIVGNINLTQAGGTGTIDNMGTITAGQTIALGTGTLTNAGTLDLRNGQGGTTLTGNYAGTGNGQVLVGANFAAGTADKLTVTGNASLNPSAIRVDATAWQKSAPVTVLTAGGSVANLAGLSASPMQGGYALGLATTVTGNSVQVQPVSNLGAAGLGLSSGAQQVANYLDTVWNSGSALGGGFSALSTIGGAGSLNSALTSVAGATVGGVAAAKQAASDRFFDNLVNCQSFNPGATPFEEDNCSWMRVIGAQTSLADTGGDPGYHQTTTTYQVGGQYEFSPGWFAGASLGFEQSWLNGGGATVNGQSGLAGVMIKHQMGSWLLTGALDGGFGSYQSSRSIDVGTQTGTATASPNVVNVGAHVRAAYQMALAGGLYVEPSLTLGALYTNMPQYQESGATSFNLNVHASNNTTASASPMVEFGAVRSIDDTHALRAFVALGGAAYSNSEWRGDANLELAPAGTGSFTVDSKLPSVVGRVKTGVDLYAGGGFDVKVSYSADAAAGFLSQAILAKLSYAF